MIKAGKLNWIMVLLKKMMTMQRVKKWKEFNIMPKNMSKDKSFSNQLQSMKSITKIKSLLNHTTSNKLPKNMPFSNQLQILTLNNFSDNVIQSMKLFIFQRTTLQSWGTNNYNQTKMSVWWVEKRMCHTWGRETWYIRERIYTRTRRTHWKISWLNTPMCWEETFLP